MELQNNIYHYNISHFLNIILINIPSKILEQQIRQEIFFQIEKVPITRIINGFNVTICWNSNSSDNYYTDVEGIFGDTAVKYHTEILFNDIVINLNNKFDNIFAKGISKIYFRNSKPLTRKICML